MFGSGLAIVPFLYSGVVNEYGWLDDRQFFDAVAVAMITPGPVVITVGFIGYLVAGFSGACLASAATFLPCFLFTIVPAPYLQEIRQAPGHRVVCRGRDGRGRRRDLRRRVRARAAHLARRRRPAAVRQRSRSSRSRSACWPADEKFREPLLVLGAALVGLMVYPYVGTVADG